MQDVARYPFRVVLDPVPCARDIVGVDVGGSLEPSADDFYRGRAVILVPARFDHDEAHAGRQHLRRVEAAPLPR